MLMTCTSKERPSRADTTAQGTKLPLPIAVAVGRALHGRHRPMEPVLGWGSDPHCLEPEHEGAQARFGRGHILANRVSEKCGPQHA